MGQKGDAGFLAHVREITKNQWAKHALEEHLRAVAERAAHFAVTFGSSDWAHVAGVWHDLGKYRPAFQNYIRRASGYDANAHIETAPGRVDHSTAGAIYAEEKLGLPGRVLAYLIAGHHAGLPDYEADITGRRSLQRRLAEGRDKGYVQETLGAAIPHDILNPPVPVFRVPGDRDGFHLWVRMLFSCLVDADFLDTEAFMDPPRATSRQGYPDIATLLTQLNAHMAKLQHDAEPTPVNAIRQAVYRQCCDKAQSPPGLFSLTVPTGGGKTLSSLVFALRHAERFGKRRVIYAIPYTSIIEQTADVFRDVFKSSEDVVVEHHSQADSAPEKEDARSRLACENWDAPLIVTTNVQLFESLYAARTSRCRKLHNIVDSVVILDEAQMLPPEYLQTICSTIKLLSTHYGVTFVFCTATQPALNSRQHLGQVFTGLDQIEEIIDDVNTLYKQLQRVEVELPQDLHTPVSWEALAEDLQQHASVLCIVNSRRDCRSLWELMPAGTYHLSALMCGQHRSEKIKEIRERLAHGEPIRVISTQLIEAGVDVDFPVVYRALAGLDSIAQAAGRCNRNGKLPHVGQVQVFVPPSSPQGLLRRGKDKTQELLSGWEEDPLSPEAFQRYFSLFYGAVDADKKSITALTTVNEDGGLPFRTLAERFQLIDDEDQITVFVRYGEGDTLLEHLRHQGPERWLMRKLQRYSVSLYQHDFRRLLQERGLEEVHPEIYAQVAGTRYDPDIGFGLDITLNPDNLII